MRLAADSCTNARRDLNPEFENSVRLGADSCTNAVPPSNSAFLWCTSQPRGTFHFAEPVGGRGWGYPGKGGWAFWGGGSVGELPQSQDEVRETRCQ